MNSARVAASVILAVGTAAAFACAPSAPPPPAETPALRALLADFHGAVSARPNDARARAELALAFEANGRWVEAAAHYARARELDPDEPQWATHAAICELEAGELARARGTLEAAVARFPTCAPLLQRLGVTQLEEGEFARARESFSALAKLEAHVVEGWTGLAELESAAGEVAAALAAADRALAADPDYRLPRYLRAVCLRDLGREFEAAREFERAGVAKRRMIGDAWSSRAAQFAVGFEARFARAVGLLDGNHGSEALAAFEALARERPDDARALGNLAMAQAAANDFVAALVSCDAALVREPNSATLHVARARVLLGAGRPSEALVAARRASELDPRGALHFEVLGLALAACGENQEAVAAWKEALRLDPSNAALRQRAQALERR